MKKEGVFLKSAVGTFAVALAIVTTVVLAVNLAFAMDPIPKKSGFSGYIGLVIGTVKYKGNMIARLDRVNYEFGEETIQTLTGEAESDEPEHGISIS